jgi:glycosyltransferase involved in cell wall biosynthesis
MKLMVTLDFPPEHGGIQRYLAAIARHRYHDGDCILVGGSATAPRTEVFEGGARVVRCGRIRPGQNKKRALVALATAYLRLRAHTRRKVRVECGNVYAALVPWLLRMPTGQSYAVYTYGTELVALRRRGLKRLLLMQVLRGAERLYALGRYTEGLLRELGLGNPVEIVSPGIERPASMPRSRGSGTDKRKRVLAVGRLVRHKGHALLIDAVGLLAGRYDVWCTIVGDGPCYEELCRSARAAGVDGRVSLRRDVSDRELEREYRRADVFVHPSRERAEGVEGFGIVLLEAMARGVPIVAARSGGIPEVVGDGECGVLVPPDDLRALVSALEGVFDGAVDVRAMTRRAYRRLVTQYVW